MPSNPYYPSYCLFCRRLLSREISTDGYCDTACRQCHAATGNQLRSRDRDRFLGVHKVLAACGGRVESSPTGIRLVGQALPLAMEITSPNDLTYAVCVFTYGYEFMNLVAIDNDFVSSPSATHTWEAFRFAFLGYINFIARTPETAEKMDAAVGPCFDAMPILNVVNDLEIFVEGSKR